MATVIERLRTWAACAQVAALCAGCAHPLLYNEARDKQGQEAKQAAEEVNLLATVEALDIKLRALSKLEIDAHTARAAISREFQIVELAAARGGTADAPLVSVQERYVGRIVMPRLQELTGSEPPLATLRAHVAGVAEIEERNRQVASKLRVLSLVARASIASCDAARQMEVPAAAAVAAIRKDAIDACDKARSPPIAAGPSSVLGTLTQDVEQDHQVVRGLQSRMLAHKQKLDDAVTTAAQSAAGKTAQERLEDGAEKLQQQLNSLNKAADTIDSSAFSAALAQLRLESLDAVLRAVASGATELDQLDASDRRAVLVIRLVPSLVDEARKWEQERTRVRTAPLVLAKDHQRLVLAGYKQLINVLGRRAANRAAMLASARAEYAALARGRMVLDVSQVDLAAPLATAIDSGSETTKLHLYQSFAAVFDEAHKHRLDRELAQLAIDASAAELATEASRSAAAQWQNLANGIAAVLGDYHAAGIKPADIAEFLKAFGLIHIGSNVGK